MEVEQIRTRRLVSDAPALLVTLDRIGVIRVAQRVADERPLAVVEDLDALELRPGLVES